MALLGRLSIIEADKSITMKSSTSSSSFYVQPVCSAICSPSGT